MPFRAVKTPEKCFFLASGQDMSPPEWGAVVPRAERLRWWGLLANEMYQAKQKEWRKNLDAYGQPLVPVRLPRTKQRSDWHGKRYVEGFGPPLLPFFFTSRGFNLLRVGWNENRAIVFWLSRRGRVPTRKRKPTWTEILWIHATQAKITRDVIGLSPEGLTEALGKALRRYRAGRVAMEPSYPATTDLGSSYYRVKPAPLRRGSPFVRFGAPRGVVNAASMTAYASTTVAAAVAPVPSRGPFAAARPRPLVVGASVLPLVLSFTDPEKVYRKGERWVVIQPPWGWEVLKDGSTELALLPYFAEEGGWEEVDPGSAVPERVLRVLDAVRGEGVAA